jgi:uncharacterized protein YbjT (DUF2867 family)
MPTDKLILVTGATGYIASRLIPRLLESDYRVRCLVREPFRLKGYSWFRSVEVISGDVMVPASLDHALVGVHTAYYLIHNMAYGHGYPALEVNCARTFVAAAEQAGVEHVIYLGGLADPDQHIASHLRSRIETGQVLREGHIPVTEFRAGVIIGSGSTSFEMLRFMTELFPAVPGPRWLRNQSQPIAVQNVIDYLLAALTNTKGRGHIFEIGGPDTLPYENVMLRYATIRGLRRKLIVLPGIPLWFMAFGVGLVTPVPRRIAYALIGGLVQDSVVKDDNARRTFPEVNLIGMDEAIRDALEKTHPSQMRRVWDTGRRGSRFIKHEGCFINHSGMIVHAEPQKVFRTIVRLCEKEGWDAEVNEDDRQVVARVPGQTAGRKWIEWHVTGQIERAAASQEKLSYLAQTIFFSPGGHPGFLYWYLLYPFHLFSFRGLIGTITKQSEDQ